MRPSPSPSILEGKAGCDVLRTSSLRINPGSSLVNIYIHELPATVARKLAYADDLAIMHSVTI